MTDQLKPKSVIIDNVKYVQELPSTEYKICILQRGWVFVGKFSQDGDMCTLTDASCIRRWGTTKGLGELAISGPTDDTVLDPAGTVKFHLLTSVAIVECTCEGSVWS